MKRKIILTSFLFLSLFTLKAKSLKKDVFDLEKVDTISYYHGSINNNKYFVKFDRIANEVVEGHAFDADKSFFADKIYFYAEKRLNHYDLSLGENKMKIKFQLNIDGDSIYGRYAVKEKFFLFINKYKWHSPISFNKYKKQEFRRFHRMFKDKIFDDIIVEKDIIYGRTKGYWNSAESNGESYWKIIQKGLISSISERDLNLTMDIYMPNDKVIKQRPLIMFIHGGGFYIGDKQSKTMVEWCKHFASMGYVTASINYRLGFNPSGASLERAGYRALQDAHAAIRYLINNKDYYGIDTSRIFTAGKSAGAITALNLAFMRNENKPKSTFSGFFRKDLGNIESSANDYNEKFSIKAVANMWGAVNEISVLNNSKTSIISFHSNGDNVVPIDCDYPFRDIDGNLTSLILNKVYGSRQIHKRANEIGLRNKFYEFDCNKHSLHLDDDNNFNERFDIICEGIKEFFYDEIFPKACKIQRKLSISPTPIYVSNCSECKEVYWDIEGGIILEQNNDYVNVVWIKDVPVHKLMLSGCYFNGAGFYDEYEF